MTQPQDKMRAEFEAWCAKENPRYRHTDDGITSRRDWKVWQAACAQQFAQSQKDALDAARFRQTIRHVGGQRNLSCQTFGLVTLRPVSGNIMQGSVAEHFTKAIDAAIATQGASNV